jgi:hypothetical protein
MIVSDLRALVFGVLSGRPNPLVAFIQQTSESGHELFVLELSSLLAELLFPLDALIK